MKNIYYSGESVFKKLPIFFAFVAIFAVGGFFAANRVLAIVPDFSDCGNSTIDLLEQCDDGNMTDGDGCSATCQMEVPPVCGDEVIETPEQCDDGNITDGDGCSATCQMEVSPICGDYVIETPEQCDDGNVTGGDGCSAVCETEAPVEYIVINEVDYNQPGSDTAEFIELKNTGSGSVNLDSYELRLINGSDNALYDTIDLPEVSLISGDYYVVCSNTTNVPNCDFSVTGLSIQNGSPDAVALYKVSGSVETLIDTVSYEGDVPGYTEGTGATADTGLVSQGLSRYVDGQDTNNNSADFILSCITPGGTNENSTDCGTPSDTDSDGIPDSSDNCLSIANADQADADDDGIGDVCDTDNDNDDVSNTTDNCPEVSNPLQADADGDGIGDECDNAPGVSNPDQSDTDNDGVGDVADNCPNVANATQSDPDGDGIGSACDNAPNNANPGQEDNDTDNVGNVADNCSSVANADQADDDGDGLGNACDQYTCRVTGVEVNGDALDNDCDGNVDNADTTAPVVTFVEPNPDNGLLTNNNDQTFKVNTSSDTESCKLYYGVVNTATTQISWYHSYPEDTNSSWTFASPDGTSYSYSDRYPNAASWGNGWVEPVVYDMSSIFHGKTINGTWRLTMRDNVGRDSGAITNIDLNINGTHYPWNGSAGIWDYHTTTVDMIVGGEGSGMAVIDMILDDNEGQKQASAFYENIPEGASAYYVECIDAVGNRGSSESRTLTVDTVAPTGTFTYDVSTPTQGNVTATLVPSETLTVTNNEGATSYTFLENGTFTFELLDTVGNIGTAVATVSNIDRTAPTFTFIAPTPGDNATTGPNNLVIEVEANEAIDSGRVDFGSLDRFCDLVVDGEQPTHAECTLSNPPEMTFSYVAHIIDLAGNRSEEMEQAVTVDATSPVMVSATENASTTVYVLFDEGLMDNEIHTPTAGDFRVARGEEEEYIDIESVSYDNETKTVTLHLVSPILPEDEPMVRVYSDEPTSIADLFGNITYRSDWMNIVKDSVKPIITLVGDSPVSLYVGDTYVDAGATAQDNIEGDITSKISAVNNVNTATAGTYIITYDVSDEVGNTADTITRTVTVSERPNVGGGAVPLSFLFGYNHPNPTPTPTAPQGQVLGETSKFIFTINLRVGSRGVDVIELQKRLRAEGFFTYPTDTGYFGSITKASVIAYQKAHGISPTSGFCGPLTRAELNK
jgi:cysteine-rich repeat protein